ncbi:unnamed protein product [Citrullus colocynthis]|uniref:1,3-beta-glucan synthase component FKS1-like domain-containing protein n=1 Tax=Citrullus colocynthis TaxID=252529 RepID=A0ABP0XUE2_9ROSI
MRAALHWDPWAMRAGGARQAHGPSTWLRLAFSPSLLGHSKRMGTLVSRNLWGLVLINMALRRSSMMRAQTLGNVAESMMDSEVVPSSLDQIAPILRVANELESNNPRVAYLCRFYAFEKAHRLDPTSNGRGVRRFKTALLQRLEQHEIMNPLLRLVMSDFQDEKTTSTNRTQSDASEMQSFYQSYYEEYIQALNEPGKADRARLTKVYRTASILFEVLEAVNQTEDVDVADEVLKVRNRIEEKQQLYRPFNILPLDPDSQNQTIMRIPEIQASVSALRNTRALPWPNNHKKRVNEDILDWLQAMFGFQEGNVANQREHLILLIANAQMRRLSEHHQRSKLDDGVLTQVMNKLFKNYRKWCRLPKIHQEVQQRKLLYMGLYLLIWGEAANLRFMPECLCYIYHHMASELCDVLSGTVSSMTGERRRPAYGGEEDAFLQKVVTPIYNVISKEVTESKNGKSKHSQWRNYDDLNEYFWCTDCFRLGWPMKSVANFFQHPSEPARSDKDDSRFAWSHDGNNVAFPGKETKYRKSMDGESKFRGRDLGAVFEADVFKKVLSIFITAAILKLAQGTEN